MWKVNSALGNKLSALPVHFCYLNIFSFIFQNNIPVKTSNQSIVVDRKLPTNRTLKMSEIRQTIY